MTEFVKRLNIMFYLVSPDEMQDSMTDDKAPEYFVEAIPYFFLLMAVEHAVALSKNRRVYRYNDTVASIMLGILQLLVEMWLRYITCITYQYLFDGYCIFESAHRSWVGWVGCLTMVDFGYYWFHRHAHTNHLVWSAHSVHHSGEDYNLATALRQGAFQGVFSWVYTLPCALFFHPSVYVHHKALNTLYQFWIHTTMIGSLGLFENVFNTPSHHRMHHRPPGNCNYAGVLIIWDRMFGTFVREDEQKDYYGLAKQYDTFDPVDANAEHIKRITKNVDTSKPRSFLFFLELFTIKRRARHPYVFWPLELFRPLPPSKKDLWTSTPAPNPRIRYDGHTGSLLFIEKFYAGFLFVNGLFLALACLIIGMELSWKDLLAMQFFSCFILKCAGRVLDGWSSKLSQMQMYRIAMYFVYTFYFTCTFPDSKWATVLQKFQLATLGDFILWMITRNTHAVKLQE